MPVVPMQQILKDAFQRYGVGAFNIVDWVTMDAVLSAAAETKSPVIVQVSVKTVKVMGAKLIQVMFAEMAGRVPVPATLHLDHCPDRKVIEECIAAGWNSVLFDASKLSYEDNLEQTRAVVELAHRHGVAVEGELEAVKGVEDGIGGEEAAARWWRSIRPWPSSARPASTASLRPSARRTACTRALRRSTSSAFRRSWRPSRSRWWCTAVRACRTRLSRN